VTASAAVRTAVAWRHSLPRYFPDEYIYAALGRSLGHGHYAIRGATTHFPGVLEPLLAAPIWRLASTETAYHLVQAENAIAASLAAIPVYLLGRRLGLHHGWSLAAGLYAVALPSLVLAAYTMSDAVAYPLSLAAVAAGVASLESPTWRRQLGFLAFATLAAAARVEYFVIVPAYCVAAIVLDRWSFVRRHRVALVALVPAVCVLVLAAFGYYSAGLRQTRIDLNYAKWYVLQPFLLSLEAGVVIVPGAVAALLTARGRRAVAFATLFGALALLLLAEATAHAADSLQFKERYLFVLLPLLPLAFGLYARERRRPLPLLAVGLALTILVAAARLPLSQYTQSTFKSDSQFLLSVGGLEPTLGIANTSLLVALLATIAAVGAGVLAFRGRPALGLAFALLVACATTVQASRIDLQTTGSLRSGYPADRTWIDRASHGSVTAVATPVSPPQDLLYELYWNPSVQREGVLSGGIPTDAFSSTKLHVGRAGVLTGARGELLVDDFGTTAWLADAQLVARRRYFALWRPRGAPRFRLLITGRFSDHWLSKSGRIRAWPAGASARGVRLAFRLSLPAGWQKTVHVRLGRLHVALHPGGAHEVVCTGGRNGVDAAFASTEVVFAQDALFRRLTVRLTRLAASDVRSVPAPSARGCSLTATNGRTEAGAQ
jgi:hypothetical protein